MQYNSLCTLNSCTLILSCGKKKNVRACLEIAPSANNYVVQYTYVHVSLACGPIHMRLESEIN